jgi:hypothetical protein
MSLFGERHIDPEAEVKAVMKSQQRLSSGIPYGVFTVLLT